MPNCAELSLDILKALGMVQSKKQRWLFFFFTRECSEWHVNVLKFWPEI